MSTRKDHSPQKPPARGPLGTQQARVARKNRQLQIFLLALVVVVVAALAGVFLYQSYLAPYRKVVIKVDDTSVRMDYFLKRLKASGYDESTIIEQLTYEQIVKVMAPQLGVKVTDAELDETMRAEAARISANVTDNATAPPLSEPAFQEWYKQAVEESGLSAAEYRDMVRVHLVAAKLQYALAQQVPTSAAQVHLHLIVVATLSDANTVKSWLDAGQPFASVASAVSIDSSKENGGDVGWVPYGTSDYDYAIFTLGVGQISSPIPADSSDSSGAQYIFMVSEEADNREIDPNPYAALQSRALKNWLQYELTQHDIKIGSNDLAEVGFNFDEQTQAWIQWQIAKK